MLLQKGSTGDLLHLPLDGDMATQLYTCEAITQNWIHTNAQMNPCKPGEI